MSAFHRMLGWASRWADYRFTLLGGLAALACTAMLLGAVPAVAATVPSGTGQQATVAVSMADRVLGGARPDSSGGCSGSVCIQVTGVLGYVLTVTAEGFHGSKPACVDGELYVNSKRIRLYGPLCYSDPDGGVVIAAWTLNRTFSNGTKICVAFTGKNAPSGKPCERIES